MPIECDGTRPECRCYKCDPDRWEDRRRRAGDVAREIIEKHTGKTFALWCSGGLEYEHNSWAALHDAIALAIADFDDA